MVEAQGAAVPPLVRCRDAGTTMGHARFAACERGFAKVHIGMAALVRELREQEDPDGWRRPLLVVSASPPRPPAGGSGLGVMSWNAHSILAARRRSRRRKVGRIQTRLQAHDVVMVQDMRDSAMLASLTYRDSQTWWHVFYVRIAQPASGALMLFVRRA